MLRNDVDNYVAMKKKKNFEIKKKLKQRKDEAKF